MANLIIIDADNPKLFNQELAHKIVMATPHIKLEEIKEIFGDDYERALKLINKILEDRKGLNAND